jgi:hypothetical protein
MSSPQRRRGRRATEVTPKMCRVCGCSDLDPCVHPDFGDPCAWTPDRESLCSVCGAFAWMMVPAITRRKITLDELVSRIRKEITRRCGLEAL